MSLETLHTGLSSDTDSSVAPSSTAVQGVTQAAHSGSVQSEGVHFGSAQSVAADEVSEVVVQTTRDLADARYWLEGDDLVLSISGQPGLEGQGIEQVIRVTDWATAEFQPGFRALDGGVLDADLVGKLAGSHSATAQSGSATGLTEIGFVDNVSGEVFVLRGGEEHRLKVGDPIFQHDEVVTSDEGAVGFVFQDESTFSIAQDARMVMDEFVYDPVSQTGYTEMSILKGAFTFASGLIADSNPTNMLITTPQAVIGVRGTAGGGLVNPDGESQFFNTDGAISVTTDVGVTVIDQVFETTFVTSRDAAPSAPVLSEAQDLLGRFSQVLEASPSALNSISTLSQVQTGQNTDDQESDDQELEDEESGSPTDADEPETGEPEATEFETDESETDESETDESETDESETDELGEEAQAETDEDVQDEQSDQGQMFELKPTSLDSVSNLGGVVEAPQNDIGDTELDVLTLPLSTQVRDSVLLETRHEPKSESLAPLQRTGSGSSIHNVVEVLGGSGSTSGSIVSSGALLSSASGSAAHITIAANNIAATGEDDLMLGNTDLLASGTGDVIAMTLDGVTMSLSYTLVSDSGTSRTFVLTDASGSALPVATVNTILTHLEFSTSSTDSSNRIFNISLEGEDGNISDVATTAVRVKDTPTLDLGAGVGENYTPIVILGTNSTGASGTSDPTHLADMTTYITSPDIAVSGSAQSITIKATGRLSTDRLLTINFIDPNNNSFEFIEQSDSFSIFGLDLKITGNSLQEGYTLTAVDGSELSAGEIEGILRELRYHHNPDSAYTGDETDQKTINIDITLAKTVGDETVNVASQSNITIIPPAHAKDFDLETPLSTSSPDDVNGQHGRAVSSVGANTAIAFGQNTAFSDDFKAVLLSLDAASVSFHYAFTLVGFTTDDKLTLNGIDISDTVNGNLFYEHPISYRYNEESSTEFTLSLLPSFALDPPENTAIQDALENLLNKWGFMLSDNLGGRSVEIKAVYTDANNVTTERTTVFEVVPNLNNGSGGWQGESGVKINDIDGPDTHDGASGYDALTIVADQVTLTENDDGITTIDTGNREHTATNYEKFIGSINGEEFIITQLPEHVVYAGGQANDDTLTFANDPNISRIIDLGSLDKVIGTLEGFENIKLDGNGVQDTLKLNGEAAAALTDATENGKKTLHIDADTNDTVDLGGEFSLRETSSGYSAYESGDSIVYITEDTSVTGLQEG